MASTIRSQAGSSTAAGQLSAALLQQTKCLIEELVQEHDLKMEGELGLFSNEQIALRKELRGTTHERMSTEMGKVKDVIM